MKIVLISLTCCILSLSSSLAQYITVDLYHGLNQPISDELPPELHPTFKHLIGYQHYRKIGSASASLLPGHTHILRPAKIFTLKLTPSRFPRHTIALQLLKENKTILNATFTPKTSTPLIITGPQYGNGLLVLVLTSSQPPKPMNNDCTTPPMPYSPSHEPLPANPQRPQTGDAGQGSHRP